MSVASEFAPDVVIPERARRSGSGRRLGARHLALVPCGPVEVGAVLPGLAARPDWELVVAPAARPLRLTRRGVMVAVLATLLLCALLIAVARLSVGQDTSQAGLAGRGAVTVQPGDTLWSIAEHSVPGRDPRLVVDHLRDVNHLASPVLTPGQTLKLG